MKKAQVWSLDFITSVVLFTLVIAMFFFAWTYVNTQSEQQRFFNDIEKAALSVSDALVRTKGMPEFWNPDNVKIIGLAADENVLNSTKVGYFFEMGNADYNRTKVLLVGTYDFFFEIKDLNGTSYGKIGIKPKERITVPVTRYCILDNRIVKVEFALIA